MKPTKHPDLFENKTKHASRNVQWLLDVLADNEWHTAMEILTKAFRDPSEGNRRWLREFAKQSNGRIAGGQQGYKLVKAMTIEEFNHYRNWMNHQAQEMKHRVIAADQIFYGRTSVHLSQPIEG